MLKSRRELFRSLSVLVASIARPLSASGQVATPQANTDLDSQIDNLLQICDSIFGVVLIDPGANAIVFERNADVPFIAASLYKLVLLADTLDKVEQGRLQLDQVSKSGKTTFSRRTARTVSSVTRPSRVVSVEELLYAAGAYSSNAAAQGLSP